MQSKTPEYRKTYEKSLKERNPEYLERQRKNARDWRKKNPDKCRENSLKRLADPEKRKRDSATKLKAHLLKRGLTEQTNAQLLLAQNNACAICKRNFSKTTRHLDHNHTNGLARGYLCSKCNNGLGFFNDSIEDLQKAIDYLRNPFARGYVQLPKDS